MLYIEPSVLDLLRSTLVMKGLSEAIVSNHNERNARSIVSHHQYVWGSQPGVGFYSTPQLPVDHGHSLDLAPWLLRLPYDDEFFQSTPNPGLPIESYDGLFEAKWRL